MNIDKNARYRASHEYARKEGAEIVVGISDHAQEALGDIVFVELPEVGKSFKQGEAFGVIESVKAASDLYMPVSGKVTAVNEDLGGAPDLVNKDCYGKGWFIKLAPTVPAEYDGLLGPDAYAAAAAED